MFTATPLLSAALHIFIGPTERPICLQCVVTSHITDLVR